jgi:hypothetical protein
MKREGFEILAQPAPGYQFVRWEKNGIPIGHEALAHERQPLHYVIVDEPMNLTAVFAAESLPLREIFLGMEDEDEDDRKNNEPGRVTASGTYAQGEQAVLTATPKRGYRFVRWKEDDNTDNPRTVTVTQDTLFTAVFALIDGYYLITLLRTPED